jgi:hypothetical protein
VGDGERLACERTSDESTSTRLSFWCWHQDLTVPDSSAQWYGSTTRTHGVKLLVTHKLDGCIREDAKNRSRVSLEQSPHARLGINILARSEHTQPRAYNSHQLVVGDERVVDELTCITLILW